MQNDKLLITVLLEGLEQAQMRQVRDIVLSMYLENEENDCSETDS